MATLKYWDGTQYQAIPGPPAGAYTAVGPTAPNASTPGTSLVPPNGFLWVDTGTTIPPQPYVPPQAPPATGYNGFTDPAGEAWISHNGSAWRKARDVLHGKVYRTGAWNVPTSQGPFGYDTILRDPLGMWGLGGATNSFVAPIAGLYLATALISCNVTTTPQIAVIVNTGTVAAGSTTGSQDVWGRVRALASTPAQLNANDTVQIWYSGSAVTTGVASVFDTWFTFDYLGTG
jgi:hypothetical protein